MTIIYGIKNCDTVKKALRWLDENNIDFTFHDYKKQSIDEAALHEALNQHGWENVINRRGTTWRKLPDSIKETMNAGRAIEVAQENPSIIKRPLLHYKDKIYLGFKNETYENIFKNQ